MMINATSLLIKLNPFKVLVIFILFGVLATSSIAQNLNDKPMVKCLIVEDTAQTLFQLRQSGFDLGDADINKTELSKEEALLLKDMIEDIKIVPVYQLQVLKEQAFQAFIQKWRKICQQRDLQMHDK